MRTTSQSRGTLRSRALRAAIAASLGLITALVGACEQKAGSAQAPKSAFVDHTFGFKLTPQSGWREAPSTSVQVPGTVVQVWMLDNGNVVAFTQEGAIAVSAEQLLQSSAAAVKAAGCTVSLEQTTKLPRGMRCP